MAGHLTPGASLARASTPPRADFTASHGVQWLAQEFGERKATAAFLVNREQYSATWLERSRADRGPERALTPERGGIGDQDRGHDRGGSHDRGGGHDFGR